jgi:hypothetical protein
MIARACARSQELAMEGPDVVHDGITKEIPKVVSIWRAGISP